MSKEQRIDLNSLRLGDKVTLTFRVHSRGAAGTAYLRHGEDHDFSLSPELQYTGIVERAPRPLEVGDRVTCSSSWSAGTVGVILCIAGTQAWIENDIGGRFTAYLNELTRVDS